MNPYIEDEKWKMGLNIVIFERIAASDFVEHSISVCPPLQDAESGTDGRLPWMQPRLDASMLGLQSNM